MKDEGRKRNSKKGAEDKNRGNYRIAISDPEVGSFLLQPLTYFFPEFFLP
jgi:hypothetical protein